MSASLIENNCESLEELLSELEAPEQKNQDTARVQTEIEEANSLIHQIEMELHGLPAKVKPAYTTKVHAFSARIQGIRRVILFAGAASKANATLVQKQAEMEQKQLGSSKLLKQAAQQLQDTIQVGTETAKELARQNEKTKTMIGSMVEVNSGIKTGGMLINKMSHWTR